MQYSYLIVTNERHKQALLYCIELIVNTISSVPHTCTYPLVNHPKLSKTFPVPESPSSPNIELSDFTPTKSRPNVERRPLDPVPEESGSFVYKSTPSKPPVIHSSSVASISSTYTSSVSVDHEIHQLNDPSICQYCQVPVDVYTEDIISLCVLCLGTCSHRIPNLISGHLSTWIIPSLAK